jgi:transposase
MGKKYYSQEFKTEAIKMVLAGKQSQAEIANELGIPNTTLSTWIKRYKDNPERGIAGSQVLSETDIELRKQAKRIKELEEENAILKKAAAYFAKNLK